VEKTLSFKSTLAKKNTLALTGLFLCFFLVIHLAGNLPLLLPAEKAQEQFNWYSALLSNNLVIKFIAYLLYFSILWHAIDALILTLKSKKANGKKYAYDKRGQVSPWYSRNMGLLGSIILAFLVVHMINFWYVYTFGPIPTDPWGRKDLYTVVVTAFSNPWITGFYILSMIALGFHLIHGFFSAFRTLGLYHPTYARIVKYVGWVYTFFITAGFIFIPLYIYFMSL